MVRMHEKTYENIFVWSHRIGSQFRSCYVFNLLPSTVLPEKTISRYYHERYHGKNFMEGIVKSGQLAVYFPLKLSEALTSFIPSIHSVYLPGNENIFEPEDVSNDRTIDQTSKIQNVERKCNQNLHQLFIKIADDKDPFHVRWH